MAPKRQQNTPLRIILRISSTGQRLVVPPGGSSRLSSSLSDILSAVEAQLPPLYSNATMVCLRKTVPFHEWSVTTLKTMLDGDDGSSGVCLTLHAGSASGGSAVAVGTSYTNTCTSSSGSIKPEASVIDRAAASLNIKPESPMDTTCSSNNNNTNPTVQQSPQSAAWTNILSQNFDTSSKSCLLTLLKLIDNVLSSSNTTNSKVRTIRYGNVNFQKRVVQCRGGVEFLYSLGFVPVYPNNPPLIGSSIMNVDDNVQPESLTLKNESREILLTGRQVLIDSAKRDFGMNDEELPQMPVVCTADNGSTKKEGSVVVVTTTKAPQQPKFDIYKGHSINIQAQQMGVSDPYYSNKTLSTTERQLQNLQAKKKNLERKLRGNDSEDTMDRCLMAYLPGSVGPNMSSATHYHDGGGGGMTESKGDSSLVASRMKRMEEERKKREEGGFTTKAMRDLERMKKAKVYSHAQIRINFPDGTHFHAKFLPTETISTIRSVIHSSLVTNSGISPLEFDLYVTPPRRLLVDTKTLEEEELVPAAKIHVSWKRSPLNTTSSIGGFLRSELFDTEHGGNHHQEALFPKSKAIVSDKKTLNDDGGGGGAVGNTNNNKGSSQKEELLMARMMGKGSLLLGGKKKKK